MKRFIGKLFFFISGWKVQAPQEDPRLKHCVMIAAPHTSNWDMPFAVAAFWIMGVNFKFFIKDFYTKSIFGWLFKAMGAIGVDRSKSGNMVDFAASKLKERDMVLMVPAEGTRGRVEKWKTGFYHIAKAAGVPIAMGFLDYDKKLAGVLDFLEPGEDFKADMDKIEKSYAGISGKHPQLWNPEIYER